MIPAAGIRDAVSELKQLLKYKQAHACHILVLARLVKRAVGLADIPDQSIIFHCLILTEMDADV